MSVNTLLWWEMVQGMGILTVSTKKVKITTSSKECHQILTPASPPPLGQNIGCINNTHRKNSSVMTRSLSLPVGEEGRTFAVGDEFFLFRLFYCYVYKTQPYTPKASQLVTNHQRADSVHECLRWQFGRERNKHIYSIM